MSDDFTYDRSWVEIQEMREQAEVEKNQQKMLIVNRKIPMSMKDKPMRTYKGLEGVCKTLRWVLGDKNMTRAEVLGRDNDGSSNQKRRV